jgi:cellulose synthase/poly-beta-1,6-N-acetylglucosamine synthase-like glycosyltransferase
VSALLTWRDLALAMAGLVILFDFQNVLSWWRGRVIGPHFRRNNDYTIVVPLYGDPRYFANRDALSRVKARVLIAMDVGTPEMRRLALQLFADGWRVACTELKRPSPPHLIGFALESGLVTTSYIIRVDADTWPLDDFGRYLESMEADGADICSVKVAVANPRTQAQKLQALEYRMAMLSRHFRPWLTSGACTVAKTEAMRQIFRFHSFWFPGEDIETGRVARALGMRVRHLDMLVETDAPASWRGLLRQRGLWWAGNFRHTVINLDKNILKMPVWSFYYLALVWVGVYFKWHTITSYASVEAFGKLVGFSLVVCVVITVLANLQVRTWRMLVFPLYAFTQALLMPIVGSIYYWVLAYRQGFLGRYRFGYRRIKPSAAPATRAAYPLQANSR